MIRRLLERLPHDEISSLEDPHRMPYMRRYYILRSRWLNVRVHEILRDDEGRALHNHPWDFLSVGLVGSYLEERPTREWLNFPVGLPKTKPRVKVAPWFIVRPASTLHRLDLLSPVVWTLVVTGPKRREWGFQTESGWIHWRDYADAMDETMADAA